MKSAAQLEVSPETVDELAELLVAQAGATDVDPQKVARGKAAFEKCSDCHSLDEGVSGSGPALFGLHGRAYYLSFISNPKPRSTWVRTRARCPGSTAISRWPTATRSPST